MSPIKDHPYKSPLGDVLRAVRRRRGWSQLDLALNAGISQRHLGFMELGRARPSRGSLVNLLDVLEASPAERTAALLHAGFGVPSVTDGSLPGDQAGTLADLATRHKDIPTIIFDEDWRSLALNTPAMVLGRCLMPRLDWSLVGPQGEGLDMVAATSHPEGLLSRARNPERAAEILLGRFELERWMRPDLTDRVKACAEELRGRYGNAITGETVDIAHQLELVFDTDVGTLHFVIMQCLVAAPYHVWLHMPRMELWLPHDDDTRHALAELNQTGTVARPGRGN